MRFCAALLIVLSATLVAEFKRSEVQNVPVDRLVATLSQRVQENPRDLETRINLARVYAMAYAQKVDQIMVRGKEPSQWTPAFTRDIDVQYQQFEVNSPPTPRSVRRRRSISRTPSRCIGTR